MSACTVVTMIWRCAIVEHFSIGKPSKITVGKHDVLLSTDVRQ